MMRVCRGGSDVQTQTPVWPNEVIKDAQNKNVVRQGVTAEEARQVRKEKGKLSSAQIVRLRVRYFSTMRRGVLYPTNSVITLPSSATMGRGRPCGSIQLVFCSMPR